MNSVEFFSESGSVVRLNPLLHASEIIIPHLFMKATLVRNEWMLVELQNNQLLKGGEGWLQWKDGENGQPGNLAIKKSFEGQVKKFI